MSYDDDNRGYPQNGQQNGRDQGRDRGAYTPPTGDDDLPFNRSGYDPRRAPASKSPPLTLIISAVVLLLLVVAVALFYRSGLRSSTDAPPAVGTPVETMKVESPLDAQPVDPEEGIRVYRDTAAPEGVTPTLTPGPEEVLPRPAPSLEAPAPVSATPPPAPKAVTQPAPVTTAPAPVKAAPVTTAPAAPKAATPASPAPAAASGSSRVQIGAFSSRAIADQQYASVAGRHGQYASGATKGVEAVTLPNGNIVYRTTFNGLSRERANAFCAAIKSSGGDCLVR
ncbi:SPOR domain-containing protein [Brevundimonas sp. BH3]|uniref:SPOR domain-containing protein n=1 Tax=Brevundimonas sp. BH3 TaxID=3133089 RepID=UPI003244D435